MQLFGRKKIFTRFPVITAENVSDVIAETSVEHARNQTEIEYLYAYFRGKQDVLSRVKQVRPEICNNVVVNRANEIVSFKVSYLLGEPIQYVSRGNADSAEINRLNEFMYSEDKESKDKEIADWFHICGVAYRMVRPDKKGEEDGSPANILTLDPRHTYTIYSRDTGAPMIGAVLVKENLSGEPVYVVYTPKLYFEVANGEIVDQQKNTLGLIPVVEYVHNEARMGAFEVVLPLLNALNVLESNRIDSVEDFVNAYDVFQNCEISSETYKELTAGGQAIQIKNTVPGMESKVYRITSELSQSGVQMVVDDTYDAILSICGMPNRNGGSSTSDTGQAVIFRDGWSDAEARAKDTESMFKRSEREFLRLFLKICKETAAKDKRAALNLTLGQISMKFTRRNYSNLQSKAQVLAEMLNNGKIHPKKAYECCGMFTDSEEAYTMGMQWYREQQAEMERSLKEELDADRGNGSISTGGQGAETPEQESDQAVSGSA